MGNDLNNAMDSTEGNNQYDEAAKRILGNKEVLSHILTNTVDEYKKMKPEDVIPLIESDPIHQYCPCGTRINKCGKDRKWRKDRWLQHRKFRKI